MSSKKHSYQSKYNLEHRDYFRKKAKEWYVKHGLTDRRRYTEYKACAKRRELEFKLSFEEFCKIRDGECFYCGMNTLPNGVDRMDNALGYLIGNVVSCCGDCNSMKNDKTVQSFIEKCKLIANRI